MYYVIFLILLLLIIIALYYMLISLRIKYKRIEQNDIISIQVVTGFGLIKYKLEIPYIDFLNNIENGGVRYKIIFKFVTGKEELIGIKRFDTISNTIENLKIIKLIYNLNKKPINYLIKKIEIDDFFIKISFGFEDALNTSMFFGLLCVFIINSLSILKTKLKINSTKINLTPIFEKSTLEAELNCIIKVRLGHIITGIKMT